VDPVTLLVSALALGATAALKETAGTAVKDAYLGLEKLIVDRFGHQPAVDALEKKPASASKQESAKEDLGAAAADGDIMKKAKELAELVHRDDPEAGAIVGISFINVLAKFLDIDTVRSSKDGVRVIDSKFEEGITAKNITAGASDPSNP
jgi:hypothetical protein